ncbi:MerR family transcriptional regulator [Sphingomonas aerophila]|uniref:Mercuric resistance operon regulatory protein n=1 Tax=Sphingomonas aerophila TaxID=1344948 RepID=A0A7W9EVR1_9SPHN|nr:MerR family DNA-binding protein [Sphingomonas aerophila]MBB5714967.1 MerR family mercuric resistance operon transcriptional regulator [Sphingomonas aerophila]
MASMTVSKLAQAGGVGIETVRYYQRRGLLTEPDRPDGSGFRSYAERDIQRLRFIRQAQAAGFTLEAIRELLALDATDDRDRARAIARERIAALDAKIAEMQAARAALSKLADDCAATSTGPCPILSAFTPEVGVAS